jgi:acyl-CoA synthetase (AMP-forming)/AMP-acid ligase II
MTPPETLGRALARAAAAPGRGLRFLDAREQETRLGWAELFAQAQRVAGGLRARGVVPGDTVALVLPTGPAFFHGFFGAVLAGAVPVPLYPPVRLGRLTEYHARTAAMLVAARARIVLADSRTWRILGEAVLRARPPLGAVDIADIDDAPFVHDLSPDDLAFVQFSSGTTVDPKPVALQHRASLANARAILSSIVRSDEDDHGVSWLPLYHDMGLVGTVFTALLHPGDLTLLPPELFVTRPATWLRALSRTGAFISPAPNFAYGLCVDRIADAELEGVDLSRWRYALNGAEPVSPGTLRRFVARFSRWGLRPEALTPVYGLAEATLAVTFSTLDRPFRVGRFDRAALADGAVVPADDGVELVSVGRPLPGFTVDAPVDAVGPVRVAGPSLMAGYLHQPERTANTLQDGWLDTGDLGFLHDGELWITGRQKDVLVLRGRKYAPHEVEQAVDAIEGVRAGCAAAVSWRPDDADEERLVVFVEVRPDVAEDPTSPLADRCASAILAATGLDPGLVVLLPPGTLPRTSSGKIRRGEALRRWLGGDLLPPDPVNAWRLAGALARGTVSHWRARLGR